MFNWHVPSNRYCSFVSQQLSVSRPNRILVRVICADTSLRSILSSISWIIGSACSDHLWSNDEPSFQLKSHQVEGPHKFNYSIDFWSFIWLVERTFHFPFSVCCVAKRLLSLDVYSHFFFHRPQSADVSCFSQIFKRENSQKNCTGLWFYFLMGRLSWRRIFAAVHVELAFKFIGKSLWRCTHLVAI